MIRTLIVEDSLTVRQHLTLTLEQSGQFDVVGAVGTAEDAIAAAEHYRPDLISLDVFLQNATASEVVKRVLAVRPVRIVLVSDAPRNSHEVFEALVAGAVDVIHKPGITDPDGKRQFLSRLAALCQLRLPAAGTPVRQPEPAPPLKPKRPIEVVVVGSSTGGPVGLAEILATLPSTFPVPVVIAQHIAEGWEPGLVSWLSGRSQVKVALARGGELLSPGHVYIGAANRDVLIRPGRTLELSGSFQRGYHPSADVLFCSAAKVFGQAALGLVLSGIGSDGAIGARDIAAARGTILAQDKESSIVFGMPEAAIRMGAATIVGPPSMLARALMSAASAHRGGHA